MKPKILFADNLHFHKRGFQSLFTFIEKYQLKHHFIEHENKELLYRYGDYTQDKALFQSKINELKNLTSDELFNYKYLTIQLFPLVKAEILTYQFSKENWYLSKVPQDSKFIFDKLYIEDKETLLLNSAVAIYWIDFWQDILKNSQEFTHCCVFSGSLIYQKVLIKLASTTQLNIMVFEHFFTGNDYYCEHKYDHIANNSDIKYDNIYNHTLDITTFSKESLYNEKIKVINKILHSQNKNVKQPKYTEDILFNSEEKTVLILGQVVNDFSILETNLDNISTITIYQELIEAIIENTNYNIIFKSHPWEKKKANIKTSLTYDQLNSFLIEKGYIYRVKIIEDYNIKSLFEQSNLVVTLCSQSALEAAFEGKKVVQLGDAFYGNKGFTSDYKNISSFIKEIDSISENLSLDEYSKYEEFLVKALQMHLVNIHHSGLKILEEKFKIKKTINLSTATPPKTIKTVVTKTVKKSFLQKLKTIPIVGSSLLWFKHKILRW